MAKHRNAKVLEYILMNLQLLASKAHEADLGSLIYMLEIAAMEAESQLTGVFPSPKIRR
jgi:urease accessory protein UreF